MSAFVTVAHTGEIPEGEGRCFDIGGRKVAVFHVDGAYHAIDDLCTHAEASLAEGKVQGDEVACPLHFATFNIRTGACTGPPASEDVHIHEVRLEGSEIRVRVT